MLKPIHIIIQQETESYSVTVISSGGMNLHTWQSAVDVGLTPEKFGSWHGTDAVFASGCCETHWISALKRPGVKNITEHSWKAVSFRFSAAIATLRNINLIICKTNCSVWYDNLLIRTGNDDSCFKFVVLYAILKVLIELNGQR